MKKKIVLVDVNVGMGNANSFMGMFGTHNQQFGGGQPAPQVLVVDTNAGAAAYQDVDCIVLLAKDSPDLRNVPNTLNDTPQVVELLTKLPKDKVVIADFSEQMVLELLQKNATITIGNDQFSYAPIDLSGRVYVGSVTQDTIAKIMAVASGKKVETPAPTGPHVQKVTRFGMAKFWNELESRAPYWRHDGSKQVDKAPETLLSQRVNNACDIMLKNVPATQQGIVATAVINRLTGYTANDAKVPDNDAGKADFYTAKALISKTPAMFQESGKRALTAVGAMLVAGGVAGAPIGIGAAMGNDAALAAIDALNAIAKDGGKALLDQLHANNPFLIAIIAGIALGLVAIPTAAIGGAEAIESASGRRTAARNLENVIEQELAKVVPTQKAPEK